MTLREWLAAEEGRTVTQLMRASGLSYVTLLHARDGKCTPRLETRLAICEATGGQVTPDSFDIGDADAA